MNPLSRTGTRVSVRINPLTHNKSGENIMNDIRIENIQRARYGRSGREVKTFMAYRYSERQKAYVYAGRHTAPARTANKDLHKFVGGDA
jgi:hypothetical protein